MGLATVGPQAIEHVQDVHQDETAEKMPSGGILSAEDGGSYHIPDKIIRFSEIPMRSQAVYGWRRGNKYLYIGISSNVIHRVLTHNIIGKVEEVLADDVIDIWYVPEGVHIHKHESDLVRFFRPIYNTEHLEYGPYTSQKKNRGKLQVVTCPMCKKEFKQNRYWQKWCSPDCSSGRPKK